ncbi:TMEM175 family protein [Micromonospora soli]|uniref:TMEM175 family protein n=1 Tax=Micromonospora sp. NBRC 110009 TaxID=3061627 RepID=UPI002673889C|nr:TMEM175 family protein [Micromonospora sp. NBRC 110009]WKU02063.1 TMEM175 family protein [Micromonospora sp. NBRC 110009]
MDRDASRVEAISDGIFAVVLTVMAVELLQHGPARASGKALPDALTQAWPSYVAYVITFAIVGNIWLAHHNMWRYVARVDQALLVFNLLMLLFVAAIPFTADLLSDNLRAGATEQRLTAALYGGALLGETLFFNLSWWWARRHGLLNPDLDPRLARAVMLRMLLRPIVYLIAFAFVFVDPFLSLLVYLASIGLFLIRGPGNLPKAARPEADRRG